MSIEASRSEGSIPLLTGLRRLFSRPQKVEQSNDGNDPQSILEGVGFLARMRGDNVSRKEFLERVKVDFSISRIYYPGVGEDLQLDEVFEGERIFYLDNFGEDYDFRYFYQPLIHHFVEADMAKAPFLDAVFDAVFIQDIHANDQELSGILRTLRFSGVVIFSLDDCVGSDKKDLTRLETHPQLEALDPPYHNSIFRLFRKLEHVPTSYVGS